MIRNDVEVQMEWSAESARRIGLWLYVESLVAISVMGVSFAGVIIALLRLG